MAESPYVAIVPDVTTGLVASQNLNKAGNDAVIAVKVISSLANIAESKLYITGTIVYSLTENKYYKFDGNDWAEYVNLARFDNNNNLDLVGGGLQDTNVETPIKLGDALNTSLDTINKTIIGSINEIESELSYLSAGVWDTPATITDNGDGTATFGDFEVLLYNNADFTGTLKKYSIAGGTLSFINGAEEYAAVKFIDDVPTLYKETVGSTINNSNIIPIFTCWRIGNVIHSLGFDSAGSGLANKAQSAMYHTELYKISTDGGLVISEELLPNPRTVSVSGGLVYTGAISQIVDDFDSSTDQLTLAYHVAGVWNYADALVYNNTQIDNGTALVSLNSSKYGVRWFYRSIGDSKQVFYVLGGQEYTKVSDAQGEIPRIDLPSIIKKHCLLVGRSIVQLNATSGVMEPIAKYSFSGMPDLGTMASQDADSVIVTGGSINGVKYGGATDYTSFEADGTMVANGAATTTEDIIMPLFVAKTGTSNIPVWATLIGNINAYRFQSNDYLECMAEIPHSYKEGSNMELHVHWATNGSNTDNRYVKWEIEYTVVNMGTGAFNSTSAPSEETLIPANTASKTHMYTSVSTFNGTGIKIGAMIVCRVRRIAAVLGSAPSADPFGLSIGVHFLQDTLGSRDGATK